MLRPILLTYVAVFCLYVAHSQPTVQKAPALLRSGEIIQAGITAYDSGLYKVAIQLYQQIDRNDTNYVWAQYELGLSYYADSQYDNSIASCIRGLSIEGGKHYAPDLYNQYGNALDASGHSDQAVKVYDEGIRKYPATSLLYMNKGSMFLAQKKYPEAEAIFEQALLIDPFSYSSHFKLGVTALRQGKMIPAMLSFTAYLLMNPQGRYHSNCITLLDAIARNKEDIQPLWSIWTGAGSEKYQTTSQIVQSGIALDKDYKSLTHIDDPLIRQLQVVFEKQDYDKDSKDFWNQYYIPYYKEVFSSGQFEVFVNQCIRSVDLQIVKEYVAKNKKEMKDLVEKAAAYFNHIMKTRTLDLHARDTVTAQYEFSDGELTGKGRISANGKKLVGPWEFYYKSGNIKSNSTYDEKGMQGASRYYYYDGTLKAIETNKDGKLEGESIHYFPDGRLYWKANYKNDDAEGESITNFKNGNLHYKANYVKGKYEGEKLTYYDNGNLSLSERYHNGALQGETLSYTESGLPDYTANYTNGKLDGAFKRYWTNGQLSIEGNYKNGEQEGVWTYYHENGKLKSQETYVKGKQEGDYKEYYANGNVYLTYHISHGVSTGDANYYDEDGKLYFIYTSEKGNINLARYFDKEGKEISRSALKDKKLELSHLNPDGTLRRHGFYNEKGNMEGENRFYFPSGTLKETDPYHDGDLNGTSFTYFPNGKTKYEVVYVDGKKNGYFRSYYNHGQVQSEGWQIDNDYQGYWLNYDEQGNLSDSSYYLDGKLQGYKTEFFPNGRKEYETRLDEDVTVEMTQYDSTGKALQHLKLPAGTGAFGMLYPDGKPYMHCQYVNGNAEGLRNFYYFDGKPLSTSYFRKGMLDSSYTTYFHSGQINWQGQYKLGEKTGIWKYYRLNGKLLREDSYKQGKLNGKSIYYYENGKIETSIEFLDDEKSGFYVMFDEGGDQLYQLSYLHDKLRSYTYPGKDGHLVPEIVVQQEAGDIKTFYANGKPACEFIYKDGSVNGFHKVWFPNGQLKESYTAVFGVKEGSFDSYYSNGQLASHYNYAHDNYHGPYKEYNVQGKLTEEGFFYNGLLHGTVRSYDDQGKLKETLQYYYGKLLTIK